MGKTKEEKGHFSKVCSVGCSQGCLVIKSLSMLSGKWGEGAQGSRELLLVFAVSRLFSPQNNSYAKWHILEWHIQILYSIKEFMDIF